MAGRPPKPMELKMLQGTAREDRTNTSAPVYPKIKKIPTIPPELKKGSYKTEAAALWRRVCGMLIAVQMLDELNIDLVRIYVNETMIYRRAMDLLSDNLIFSDPTTGAPKPHPARRIASDAMKNLTSLAREFGLTPSTRQKVRTGAPAPTPIKKRTRKKTAADIAIEMEL